MLDRIHLIPFPISLTLGIVLLILGGNWLVDGAVRAARRFGVSTLLIGLTIVAFGTSSPELAFNLTAALNGNGELSFGNVVGSNIANIALVLGLAALVSPLVVHGRVVKKELPLLIIVSAGMLALAWLPLTRLPSDDGPRCAFTAPDGCAFLAVFLLFIWLWYRMAKVDRADPLASDVDSETASPRPPSLAAAIFLFLIGFAALVVGGKLTQIGAVAFAEFLNLSQALIGFTIVAVATSLPEVATSLIACKKGHNDLAIGNVVGSNLFNILFVLGLTALLAPVPVPLHRGWTDLAVMLGLTVMLLSILFANHRQILKWEGALLFLCYIAYIVASTIRELNP